MSLQDRKTNPAVYGRFLQDITTIDFKISEIE